MWAVSLSRLLWYTVPRTALAATSAACARLRRPVRLAPTVSSSGGPVLVEPGVLKLGAHADGRISRATACANYCVQLTAGRLAVAISAAALARRS